MAKKIGLIELTGDAFFEDFKTLLSLPESTIKRLAKTVNTEKGFEVSEEAGLAIVEETEIDAKALSDSLSVAYNLFREARKKKIPIDDVLAELAKYCTKRGLEGFEAKRGAIGSLIEVKPEYRDWFRSRLHERSVLDNLASIDAACDLRAVFRDEKFMKFVPVCIFQLHLKNDEDEEKTVSFQTGEDGLEKLHASIGTYLKRLKKLEPPVTDRGNED